MKQELMSSMARFELEKFDGTGDFALWRESLKGILVHQKVSKVLGDESLLAEKKPEEKAEMEEMAYYTIIMYLSNSVRRKLSTEKTAKGIWDKLEELYMKPSIASKINLLERLYGFRMNSTLSLDENIDKFNEIIVGLANINHKVDEESQAIILLRSLPIAYQEVKAAIKYGRDVISLADVHGALKSKDFELQLEKESKKEEVYLARGRTNKRGNSRSKHHHSQSRSKSRERETRKCYFCGRPGHLQRYCNKYKEQQSLNKSQNGERKDNKPHYKKKESVAVAEDNDDCSTDGELFSISESSTNREWILDSGCTYHMCPDRESFFDYKSIDGGKVLMGNDFSCRIIGTGKIAIKQYDGGIKVLKNVRHIPELRRNLISLGALEDEGYGYKSINGSLKITKGSLIVMKGDKINGLYILQGETVPTAEASLVKGQESDMQLWHHRLGHISEQGLKELHKQGIIKSLNSCALPFCEACVLGKQHKLKFTPARHTTKKILEYVHADLWGPYKVPTHSGKQYFLSIVDDYSRCVWTYLLTAKSECLEQFKIWKIQVENQTDLKVKNLRTDNGLEFINSEFNKLCEENGITRHRTVVRTPEQNGVAERMNRTLLNKIRCLLFSSGLEKPFWGEALATATYLINRSPNRSIGLKTPYEMWYNRIPNLMHLKSFGCTAYVHQSIDKLEPRSVKGIFLGYALGTKGYRICISNKGKPKVVIARNVIFNEHEFPKLTAEKGSCFTDNAGPSETKNTASIEIDKELIDGDATEQQADATDQTNEQDEHGQEDLANYQLARDRTRREIHPPARFAEADLIEFALAVVQQTEIAEPDSYEEAISGKHKSQ